MKVSSRPYTYLARRICMGYCTNSNGKDYNMKLPEEPTNCCMSGCANCVWIEYAENLAKLFQDGGTKAKQIIMEKVSDPNMQAFLNTELRIIEMKRKASKPDKT